MFEGNEGFIYASHAAVNRTPVVSSPKSGSLLRCTAEIQAARPVSGKVTGGMSILNNSMVRPMPERYCRGKSGKGMNPEMVKDSWGSPRKINRIINDNTVREGMDLQQDHAVFPETAP
jgi:hypothetical protein